MKCVNCSIPALFEYRLTEETSIFYCDKDLPKFLEERKKAGLLNLTQEYKDSAKTALEAVTYDPSIPVSTEEAPKKKTTKKSAK
jgi:hypothetical protein